MQSLLLAILMAAGPQGAPPPAAPQAAELDGNAAYYFLLGRRLEGQGKIDEAVAAHKRAIELQPDSAELRAELAGLYARQDRAAEALEMAEAALKSDPDNQEANRILGSIYAAFSDQKHALRPGEDPADYPRRAIAALEKARQPGGFDVGLDLTLGRLYVQTAEFAKAVPILQRVVADQPGYPDAAFLLAIAQEGAGRPADAITTLQQVLQNHPRFYRGQLRLAELYEREKQYAAAAAAYERAQALNPRAAALTARRAASLINAGKPAQAREILEQALSAAKPGTQDTMQLYLLAEAQRVLADYDAAEGSARQVLAKDPDDIRALHVLSLILQDKGSYGEAEKILRDLIARDPRDANALNSLGYMLAERGERLDEAVGLLQRALKLEPGNPSYLDSLGWAYVQQGRLDLADKPLTEAAAQLEDSSVVQDHLGDLRFKQRRYADAAAAWERALAGDGVSISRPKIEQKLRDARGRMESR
jgi:tetratricopeptide (TPR) repeat protein